MPLDLVNYEKAARAAVRNFWSSRESARQRQIEQGKADQGERASVTAGKNMNGFIDLFRNVIIANGLPPESIFLKKAALTLPGFFVRRNCGTCLLLMRDV